MENLSENNTRNNLYNSFLDIAKSSFVTIEDIIRLGVSVMRNENLNYDHSYGTAELDSRYLAFFSLKLPYEYDKELYSKAKVSAYEIINFIKLLEKRVSLKLPLPYVTNEKWYLGWRFYVNEHTLLPRSLMNHKFKEFLQEIKWNNYRVLDLCTGSGCVGISLALMEPRITVDLVDISLNALEVAKTNIGLFFLQKRVNTIHSDLFTNITEKYDLIITNPPYVPTDEYNSMWSEEYKNEPKMALEAGKKGMDIVSKILDNAWKYLNNDGVLIDSRNWIFHSRFLQTGISQSTI